jgi:hypothetical protein
MQTNSIHLFHVLIEFLQSYLFVGAGSTAGFAEASPGGNCTDAACTKSDSLPSLRIFSAALYCMCACMHMHKYMYACIYKYINQANKTSLELVASASKRDG